MPKRQLKLAAFFQPATVASTLPSTPSLASTATPSVSVDRGMDENKINNQESVAASDSPRSKRQRTESSVSPVDPQDNAVTFNSRDKSFSGHDGSGSTVTTFSTSTSTTPSSLSVDANADVGPASQSTHTFVGGSVTPNPTEFHKRQRKDSFPSPMKDDSEDDDDRRRGAKS